MIWDNNVRQSIQPECIQITATDANLAMEVPCGSAETRVCEPTGSGNVTCFGF
jgi:hypothetical protein